MSSYPPPPGPRPGSSVGQRIDEAIELMELELRHAVSYVNDAVIPQVRHESISAMRKVSDKLRDLADRIDQPPPSQANPNSSFNPNPNKDTRP